MIPCNHYKTFEIYVILGQKKIIALMMMIQFHRLNVVMVILHLHQHQ
jgi:hypothetical protein